MKKHMTKEQIVRLPEGRCCSVCATCDYFAKKGSVDWCYHPLKNYSTSPNGGSGCPYYKRR